MPARRYGALTYPQVFFSDTGRSGTSADLRSYFSPVKTIVSDGEKARKHIFSNVSIIWFSPFRGQFSTGVSANKPKPFRKPGFGEANYGEGCADERRRPWTCAPSGPLGRRVGRRTWRAPPDRIQPVFRRSADGGKRWSAPMAGRTDCGPSRESVEQKTFLGPWRYSTQCPPNTRSATGPATRSVFRSQIPTTQYRRPRGPAVPRVWATALRREPGAASRRTTLALHPISSGGFLG